ncbi:hypothetical protein BS78_01G267300 [Paspalum vaginatum]|nr:hypothetical protein BS78_01G267300 [Paspalum vaginatum]
MLPRSSEADTPRRRASLDPPPPLTAHLAQVVDPLRTTLMYYLEKLLRSPTPPHAKAVRSSTPTPPNRAPPTLATDGLAASAVDPPRWSDFPPAANSRYMQDCLVKRVRFADSVPGRGRSSPSNYLQHHQTLK